MITPESIHRMRREAGLTQSELAIEVGVSQSYIARIENGTLDPKLSIANKIIQVFNTRSPQRCGDVMTANPITIDARKSVSAAFQIMRQRSFSQLPVVRGERIVGIVTERDIVRNLQHDMDKLSVQAIMSSGGVPTVDETTPVDAIIPLLESYQAVVIQNQGRVTGIISRSDLLRAKR
ncbi:MAG: CBS domain-containing protein [Candidatus Thorarchaeota archaeon]|nr:CBS domain-containing protein [Candidatus Thorarchaeota archaeon]